MYSYKDLKLCGIITKKSFKTTISNSIERIISQIEMQSMANSLNEKMHVKVWANFFYETY